MSTELVKREAVNEMAQRIADFIPGAKTVPLETRLAMAQIALAHRFDPFMGDIWPIPERKKVNGEWVTVGYRIMIGITAWRRSAHETEEYWGRRFEKCTEEERKWLKAGPNDLTMKCVVMRRKTGQQPMEFDGYGIFHADESSKMNPLQCVRLRAERDALKGAFPIGFGGGAVKIGVADDTGEEINGDYQHDPEWTEPIATEETIDAEVTIIDQELSKPEQIPEPKPTPKASTPNPVKVKIATVKFNGMSYDNWHERALEFAKQHTNWQKNGAADMNHILASAAHAGYAEITGANVDAVFSAIVAAHEAKA